MREHTWAMVDAVADEEIHQQTTWQTFVSARAQARYWRLYGQRCTGMSSDALAQYGLRGAREPGRGEYPSDLWDLASCERTYRMAPVDVRERMRPVLEKYRKHVEQHWPR